MNTPDVFLFRRRRWILSLWLLLTALGTAVLLTRFRIDNSVGVWFPKEDPALSVYEETLASFGAYEWTLLMLETEKDYKDAGLVEIDHGPRVASTPVKPMLATLKTTRRTDPGEDMRLILADDVNLIPTTAPSGMSVPAGEVYYPPVSFFAPEKRYGDSNIPLKIDIEDDAISGISRDLDLLQTGAVVAAVHLGPLDKGLGSDHLHECVFRDKMILSPVHLRRSWRPSRVGDREAQRRKLVAETGA